MVTMSQLRARVHKPHLRLITATAARGQWYCTNGEVWAIHTTPFLAFELWAKAWAEAAA